MFNRWWSRLSAPSSWFGPTEDFLWKEGVRVLQVPEGPAVWSKASVNQRSPSLGTSLPQAEQAGVGCTRHSQDSAGSLSSSETHGSGKKEAVAQLMGTLGSPGL